MLVNVLGISFNYLYNDTATGLANALGKISAFEKSFI